MTPRGAIEDRLTEPVLDQPPPLIDEFGVLRHRGAWLSLTPVQESIMRCLINRLGHAVSPKEIAAAAWPAGGPDLHAINVHLHRLRPRLKDLGLVVHTLRGRGFLLESPSG